MKAILSTISSKGQVTVPASVRRHLGVNANDRIAFVLEDEGTVRLEVPVYPTVASLAGAAGSLEKPLTWAEMRRVAHEDRLGKTSNNKP